MIYGGILHIDEEIKQKLPTKCSDYLKVYCNPLSFFQNARTIYPKLYRKDLKLSLLQIYIILKFSQHLQKLLLVAKAKDYCTQAHDQVEFETEKQLNFLCICKS